MKKWSPEWFDQFYLDQYGLLKNCAYRSLRDEMIADEIVQEAFLIFLAKAEELRRERHPNIAGWLMVVVQHLVKNELGKACYRIECPLNDDEVIITEDQPKILGEILPNKLSAEDRQILVWLFEDCYGTHEISRLLKVPAGIARVKIHRAKEKYRKISKKEKKLKQNGLLKTYSSEGV